MRNLNYIVAGTMLLVVVTILILFQKSQLFTIPVNLLPASTVDILNLVPTNTGNDQFGITMLYPNESNGRTWFSKWNIASLILHSGDRDTRNNPMMIARGTGTTTISNGTATMEGDAPRLYIYDSNKQLKWNNVEVTVYGKRVSESGIASSQGIVIGARSEHQDATDLLPCLGRTYYARLLYDGRAVFQKEVIHEGAYSNNQPSETNTINWGTSDGQMPKNVWIGMKFIVVTNPDGKSVTLQMYIDRTGNVNGGTWQKVAEYVDNGNWSQIDSTADVNAVCGYSANKVLTTPGTSVFIRNDKISSAQYKWFSIREIGLPQTSDTTAPSAPSALTTTGKTDTSVNLSWGASTDSVGVTGYDIFNDTSNIGTTNNLTYTINGLSANTTYTMSVKAHDAAGNISLPSNALSITTTRSPTAEPVMVVVGVSSIAQSSVIVKWTTDVGADSLVEFGETTTYGQKSYDGSAITKHSMLISGLSPDTKYHYHIVSKNPAGVGHTSWDRTFVTTPLTSSPAPDIDITPPAAPTISIKAISEKSIDLQWSPLSDPSVPVMYDIYMEDKKIDSTTSTEYKAPNLASNTTYNFSIKAIDGVGNESLSSNELMATTDKVNVIIETPREDYHQSGGGGGGGGSSVTPRVSVDNVPEFIPVNTPTPVVVPSVPLPVPQSLPTPDQVMPIHIEPIDAAIKFSNGTRGEAVLRVQQFLKLLNLFAVIPNGRYGPITKRAVQQFQLINHVTSAKSNGYGNIGPLTRKKMNEIYQVINPGQQLFGQ